MAKNTNDTTLALGLLKELSSSQMTDANRLTKLSDQALSAIDAFRTDLGSLSANIQIKNNSVNQQLQAAINQIRTNIDTAFLNKKNEISQLTASLSSLTQRFDNLCLPKSELTKPKQYISNNTGMNSFLQSILEQLMSDLASLTET